jgi:hypothetical protein
MGECPFCGTRITQQGQSSWFECPGCRHWLRVTIADNGIPVYSTGVFANGQFHIVRIEPRGGQRQPVPALARGQASTPPGDQANVNDLDLPAVQTARRRIEARLAELETRLRSIYDVRSQSRQGNELRRYNTELSQVAAEQNRLQDRWQQLATRETALQQQRVQRSTSRATWAFGCGTLLAAAGIYAFIRMINLHLDPRAIIVAAVIALVSGLLTIVIAHIE